MNNAPDNAVPFVKMEGAGNDYVYLDWRDRTEPPEDAPILARELADRHRGVGGDGLIALGRSHLADVRMWMWNADGSRGSMCGNGARCLAKLAHDLGLVQGDHLTLETDAGLRRVELLRDGQGGVVAARVDMGEVAVERETRPFVAAGQTWHYHKADAGNLHAVVFVDQAPGDLPVLEVGAAFQTADVFPDGVNVEFVQVVARDRLLQRTFERGSGETLACGTGATAAAAAAFLSGRVAGNSVEVVLSGGVLRVLRHGPALVLEGPARTVARGIYLRPDSRRTPWNG